MLTCRCCCRPFSEFDADEVQCDPASGTILILVAPADGLCRACTDPEDHPYTHADAHLEDY